RTAGDIRHYFDKFGGNLGQTGSVSFLFQRQGVIVIDGAGKDEDQVMEDALEAGAEDFNAADGVFEIVTSPNECGTVRAALEGKGYDFLSAGVEYTPVTTTRLEDPEQITKMNRLLEMLEDDDDVQEVFHNWENPPEE